MALPEAEKLERWFLEILRQELDDGSEYPLLLVAVGEKPAALTMNLTDDQAEVLREFCEEFELEVLFSEGRVSKPGRVLDDSEQRPQKAAFIAESEDRFALLEEGRFYGFSDRSVGRFLDFPESAVEFFAESEQPGMESKREIEELKSTGEIQDVDYLALTTFIPAPDRESLEEAIRTGKDREEKLKHIERGMDTKLFSDFIRSRKQSSLY